MKIIRTNISEGVETVRINEISAFEVREKNGKKVYWYAFNLGEMSLPEALVTEYMTINGDHYITVNWDK